MNDIIQVGLVGFGNSAKNFHAPLINALDQFNLKKVVRKSGKPLPGSFSSVELEKDFKSLLKDDTIDLVVITTPNHLHYEQAHQSLSANKNVVVEKPFTVSVDEAKKLMRLASSQNRVLSVYQNRRWDGDFLTLKQVLKNELVGKPAEFVSMFNRFRNYFKEDAWKEKDLPGSGILYDLGPHLIDQTLQLFGKPDFIYADIRVQREGDVDDYFEIDLYYPAMKAKLKAGMLVAEETPRFTLRGQTGSFIKYGLDPQEGDLSAGKKPGNENWGVEPKERWGSLYKWDGNKIKQEIIETLPGNYLDFYRELAAAIWNDEKSPVTPTDAMNVINVVELARKSNTQGRKLPVQLQLKKDD